MSQLEPSAGRWQLASTSRDSALCPPRAQASPGGRALGRHCADSPQDQHPSLRSSAAPEAAAACGMHSRSMTTFRLFI